MGARRIGLRGGSVFAGLVMLVGCNAIFGIEEGEPAPAEADAGATSSGGASGTAQGGETSTGGSSGGNAGSGASSGGGQGGASGTGGNASGGGGRGGTSTGGAATGGKGGDSTGGTNTGGATGGAGAGAGSGGAGPGGAGGAGGATGTVRYDFEGTGNLDGFLENMDCSTLAVSQSTDRHAGSSGSGSLKLTLTGPQTNCEALYVRRDSPSGLSPGQTVTFSVYLPPVSAGTLDWVDLIVEDGNYEWTIYETTMPWQRETWLTFNYTIPQTLLAPVRAIGFDIGVEPGFDGSVYIDQIRW